MKWNSLLALFVLGTSPFGSDLAIGQTVSTSKEGASAAAKQPAAGDCWVELVSDEGPVGFGNLSDKISRCGDATLGDKARQLEAVPGQGVVASLQRSGVPNLVSKQEFGDCEVHLEFLIANGSNSGIKLQKRYEIQLYDSHGKDKLTAKDCGGIYPHWVPRGNGKGIKYIDEGVPAQANATKPAGEWQSLSVVFKAPRFDDEGNKTENGKFESVTLNGQMIHQDVEVDSPTGNAATPLPEVAEAPLMLQLDHGAVAFRRVRVKPL